METKPYTIKELFDNDSFRRFAPLFIDKSRTVSEVANKSGISRQTIIHLMKSVERYVVSPNWSSTVKGRPFSLNSKILIDYLAIKLDLEADEKTVLDDIILNPLLNQVIIKNNDDLDVCVGKVLLSILLIGSGFYDDALPKNTLFTGDFLFRIFLNKQPVKKNKRVKNNIINKTIVEHFEFTTNYFGVSEEEFENWKLELHKYAKKIDNSDSFWGLVRKVRDLRMPIVTYPNQWHEIFSMTIPALLHYSNYITQKYKKKT